METITVNDVDPRENLEIQESYYPDEEQFYETHHPIPWNIRLEFKKCFDDRKKFEELKYKKREEIRKLIKEYDDLSKQLIIVKKRKIDAVTDEEEKQRTKQRTDEISAIENQIKKKMEDVTNLQNKVKDIEKEIDEANQEIKELEKNLC